MNSSEYDYRGLLASAWDLWRDNTADWSDRFFFLDFIRQYGEPVLDLGCGTGRLILDYLAEGIDTDGVDNSPEMLAICREKGQKAGLSPGLFQQRIETLALPRTYRTILGPSSVLQLVTDAEAARRALGRIYAHLQPGGVFVTSFSFEWREGDPLDSGWQLLFEKRRPADGAIVRSWTHEWHEPEKQLWHSEQRFEVEREGKVIETEFQRRCPEGRWYTQTQAAELFRDMGFADIKVFHEFTQEPARPEDRLWCVAGVRPET